MGIIIGILSLGVAAITGLTSLVSASKDTTDEISKSSVNIGGLALIAIGGFLVYKYSKK